MGQVECIQCGASFEPTSRDNDGIVRGLSECPVGGKCFTIVLDSEELQRHTRAAANVDVPDAPVAAGRGPASGAGGATPAMPARNPTFSRQWTSGADKIRRVYAAKRAARGIAARARSLLRAAMSGEPIDASMLPPPAETMDIQLKGRVKVAIPVPVTATVAELSAIIRSELGDARAFKLIHRGKTLKVPGATLVSLGVKNRSKIMVMASKHAVKEEEVAVPCQGPGCGLWGFPSNGNLCSRCMVAARSAAPATDTKAEEPAATPTPEDPDDAEAIMRRKRRYEGTKLNKKDRCAVASCAKRLKHVGFDCRCGLQFCRKHSYSSEHNCDFDHAAFNKKLLSKAMPTLEGDHGLHDNL